MVIMKTALVALILSQSWLIWWVYYRGFFLWSENDNCFLTTCVVKFLGDLFKDKIKVTRKIQLERLFLVLTKFALFLTYFSSGLLIEKNINVVQDSFKT